MFIIRHFKSHRGLIAVHVTGVRKNEVLEGVSVTFPVLFTYYFQAMTSCTQLWLQFVAKENAMFSVITNGFRKINSHLKAKQAATVFALRDKEKHMKEMRYILL